MGLRAAAEGHVVHPVVMPQHPDSLRLHSAASQRPHGHQYLGDAEAEGAVGHRRAAGTGDRGVHGYQPALRRLGAEEGPGGAGWGRPWRRPGVLLLRGHGWCGDEEHPSLCVLKGPAPISVGLAGNDAVVGRARSPYARRGEKDPGQEQGRLAPKMPGLVPSYMDGSAMYHSAGTGLTVDCT